MNIAVVLGTRPEIIKMSPIIRELERKGVDFFILHTGQHYSYNMDEVFFEQLKLPQPKYNLKVGSGSHGEQTGKMLIELERVLLMAQPNVVLVQGDTNTTLAGALAASKIRIEIGHVEAGLRSFDREMPEEVNRLLVDHLSDFLFAPTERARQNLLSEGIDGSRIHVTGNTVVDAVYQNLELAKRSNVLSKFDLKNNGYFLLTLHRQENVDRVDRLKSILKGVELASKEFDLPVVYPIHPRTLKMLKQFQLKVGGGLLVIDPLDYLSFLKLESEARLILTDSGGVQEEACILKVPCVTLRYNTERPETLEVGSNVLAGTEPKSIVEKVGLMLNRERKWSNPFGDGYASQRIVSIICNYCFA